jgi:hypothetical protein
MRQFEIIDIYYPAQSVLQLNEGLRLLTTSKQPFYRRKQQKRRPKAALLVYWQ